MATLRPAAPQDENEAAFRPRVKFDGAHGGAPPSAAKGLGGSRGGAKTPGLSTGRKALGDLTNRTGLGGKTPGRTPGAGGGKAAAQRVLGDITNVTPAQKAPAPAEAQPAPSAAAEPAVAAASQAHVWAQDGIERLAGKGWLQLEQERLQRAGAEVRARTRCAVLPWARQQLTLQDLSLQELVRRQQEAAAGLDPVPECPPSPTPPSSPTAADANSVMLGDGGTLADLLPSLDDAALLEKQSDDTTASND